MKPLFALIAIAIALVVIFNLSPAASAVATLNIYEGSADVVTDEQSVPGATGTPIHKGDVIKVGEGSRVSVILKDGSVFRLEAGSEVTVEELLYEGEEIERVDLHLKNGRVWSKVEPLQADATYEVETPNIVAAVRGTSFTVDELPPFSTVYVNGGTVNVSLVEDPTQEVDLTGGQVIRVHEDDAPTDFDGSVTSIEEQDDWIRFNTEEDAALEGVTLTSSSASSSVDSSSSSAISRATTSITRSAQTSIATTTIPSSAATSLAKSSAAASTIASSRSSARSTAAVTLKSLTLSAESTQLVPNESTQLSLVATYSNGTTSNNPAGATWTVIPPNGGYVNASYDFLALEPGKIAVGATLDGVRSNSVTITVQGDGAAASQQPASSAAPASPQVIFMTVRCAKQQSTSSPYPPSQCTAMATYDDDKTVNVTQQASWSVSGSAGGQITSSGYYTPAQEGSATVTAVYNDVSGSVTFSVP